ncbi:hypothetical protein DXH95_15905 [Sphingorhabdus pulchriflava]|uniref:Uncharacterized protein n=1 Tax=Sphingorhabdus pulchriflava TaxID=2292257 RepID=A0A371B2G3_9SPHN|nr:hypothetical protein DXH95_15905 [Sphingorhabdus pulchriflava]
MIQFLRVGRTPRSFAASMAGFRQGLALLHPQGRNAVEDGADRGFLSREEWAQPRGRNFGLPRCSKGQEAQPSAGNQSH